MISPQELIKKYEDEKPVYEAWGNYVCEKITNDLKGKLEPEIDLDTFLKVKCSPRLKDVDSLISKAFYRKKYSDPYNDVTDKIGMRFVVLLLRDIKTVEEIISKQSDWDISKDRDFEEEREKNPFEFNYQSKHYIVRNKEEIRIKGITIPPQTPCEIQIRTLLQHAYSELSHDAIYKHADNQEPTPKVKRLVARSMALIETTDDIFHMTWDKLEEARKPFIQLYQKLSSFYLETIGKQDFEEKFNLDIIVSLSSKYDEIKSTSIMDNVSSFFSKNNFLFERIQQSRKDLFLFRQPIIFLLYFLVQEKSNTLPSYYPYVADELSPLYADLGIKKPS
jgi:ppGpp synthetase/RelA/SpoT-type nucleotidyltranferase